MDYSQIIGKVLQEKSKTDTHINTDNTTTDTDTQDNSTDTVDTGVDSSDDQADTVADQVTAADATTDAGSPDTQSDQLPDDDHDDLAIDYDALLHQKFGKGLSEIEELLKNPVQTTATPQVPEFANETSKQIYELLVAGKIDEVAAALSEKTRYASLKSETPENVLKAYIRAQNPDFDESEVNDEYDENYGFSEDDFDLELDKSKVTRHKKKIEQRKKQDVAEALKFFEKNSEEIKLPEFSASPDQGSEMDKLLEEYERTSKQKSLELKETLKTMAPQGKNIPFTYEHKDSRFKMNGSIEFTMADKYDEAKEAVSDYEAFIKAEYIDEANGKVNLDKMIEDVYFIRNKQSILTAAAAQAVNQYKIHQLKEKKNIRTPQAAPVSVTPDAKTLKDELIQNLFMNRK